MSVDAGIRVTPPSGDARFSRALADATADTVLTNTVAEAVIASYTIPPNSVQPGTMFGVKVGFNVDWVNPSGTLTFRLRIAGVGGASLAGFGIGSQASVGAAQMGWAEYMATVRTIGPAGTIIGNGNIRAQMGNTSAAVGAAVQPMDTTIANDLVWTAQWGTADPGNILRVSNALIELVKP